MKITTPLLFLGLPFTLGLNFIPLPLKAQNLDHRPNFRPVDPPQQIQPLAPLSTPNQASPEEILRPLPEPILEQSINQGPPDICVQGFNFEGNTVFNNQVLNNVINQELNLKPEANQCVNLSFNQIIQARSIITRFYLANNYPAAFAYIPEQQEVPVSGATITMQIIEGEIEEVRIKGNKRLNSGYIKSRITRGVTKPLNQERLVKNLLLLQRNPLIARVNAELSTGLKPGSAILDVTIEEADSFNVQAVLDNNRSPSVGSFRRILSLNEGNLLGLGDGLEINFENTDGSNELDLGYTVPFNANDGTIGLKYRVSFSEVIEYPFDELDLESDYQDFEFTLRQPIIRQVSEQSSQELALGFNFSRQESQGSILGEKFPISLGAEDNGETNISTLRFFQEYIHKSFKDVFLARSEFSLGVDWFDATINDGTEPLSDAELPDSNYFLWRGQVQWLRLLKPNTTLLLRSGIQIADRPLLSLEQFSIGGDYTVRGYRQDARLTDNGITATAELQFPLYSSSKQDNLFSIHPFVDVGTGWNTDRDSPEDSTLLGVGFGLQWRSSERFKARVDWGIPVISIKEPEERTWQEHGIYFSLEYNFF